MMTSTEEEAVAAGVSGPREAVSVTRWAMAVAEEAVAVAVTVAAGSPDPKSESESEAPTVVVSPVASVIVTTVPAAMPPAPARREETVVRLGIEEMEHLRAQIPDPGAQSLSIPGADRAAAPKDLPEVVTVTTEQLVGQRVNPLPLPMGEIDPIETGHREEEGEERRVSLVTL